VGIQVESLRSARCRCLNAEPDCFTLLNVKQIGSAKNIVRPFAPILTRLIQNKCDTWSRRHSAAACLPIQTCNDGTKATWGPMLWFLKRFGQKM
jgi:hypothetical protein